jgi:hypothetical protein
MASFTSLWYFPEGKYFLEDPNYIPNHFWLQNHGYVDYSDLDLLYKPI